MARALRIEYAGAHYHVLNRGNGGEDVFEQQQDKENFLCYVGEAAAKYRLSVHTYCLMSNHYHILVETHEPNLSAAMQWLNISYAGWYNKKHNRRGHIFQGRFKAYLLEADEYLATVSRYIHLNPVRARLVEKPAQYSWSSYGYFAGEGKAPEWLKTRGVLEFFNARTAKAKAAYRGFVEDVRIAELEDPHKAAREGFIIGGEGFVNWVQTSIVGKRMEEKEIPQLRRLMPRPALERIIGSVADEFGCSREDIQQSGKKNNRARDIAIYIARSISGMSCKALGESFGAITGAGITMKYKQMQAAIERDKGLQKKVRGIQRQIISI